MPRRPRKNLRKKVKLNVKKNKKKLRFEDPEIRKRWDKDKSPHQNYKNLGLLLDPNVRGTTTPENPVEFKLPDPPPPRPKNHEKRMAKMEELYYRALVDKHGTNFKAMERDIKLNYYQLSETKLEKRARFYIEAYRKPKEERQRQRMEQIRQQASQEEEEEVEGQDEVEDEDEEKDETGEEEVEDVGNEAEDEDGNDVNIQG